MLTGLLLMPLLCGRLLLLSVLLLRVALTEDGLMLLCSIRCGAPPPGRPAANTVRQLGVCDPAAAVETIFPTTTRVLLPPFPAVMQALVLADPAKATAMPRLLCACATMISGAAVICPCCPALPEVALRPCLVATFCPPVDCLAEMGALPILIAPTAPQNPAEAAVAAIRICCVAFVLAPTI